MMTATNATVKETLNQKSEMNGIEICFGTLMGIAAITGIWCVASAIISYLAS